MKALSHRLVGGSPEMARVLQFIALASQRNRNILIGGESGTGKELVAEAIQANSVRAAKPFIKVNCGALSEEVLDNELFGHEKEAFTGASSRMAGKFEAAEGGTLFLDEIGETSNEFQRRLLRVLEDGEITRVGGHVPVKCDVRLIVATNRDLHRVSRTGDFRQDLYYRLHVLSVVLPPLRERREDIPTLAEYFLARVAEEDDEPVARLSEEALALLVQYDWPGNIRELKHLIERATAFCTDGVIEAGQVAELENDSPAATVGEAYPYENETLSRVTYLAKRRHVEYVLQKTYGDTVKAARILDLHPSGMQRLLDSLDLSHLKRRPRTH